MEKRILHLITRTPLHVGAGESIGAIDQTIRRERHTGLPIIPGSTLKGVFADEWTDIIGKPQTAADGKPLLDPSGKPVVKREGVRQPNGAWLFGTDGNTDFAAGALQFGEARMLAFPIRSARGSFAWLTCPLMLQRAARDGVISLSETDFAHLQTGLSDETALFPPSSPISLGNQIVLEEYAFELARKSDGSLGEREAANGAADTALKTLGAKLKALAPTDDVWQEVGTRIVVLSNGMMSFFASTACEIAQHVRIDDATGTADDGGLFNQENVPSDTLFYAVLYATDERAKFRSSTSVRSAADAFFEFKKLLTTRSVFQFGADASTGLGYCTVQMPDPPVPGPALPPAAGQSNVNPGRK